MDKGGDENIATVNEYDVDRANEGRSGDVHVDEQDGTPSPTLEENAEQDVVSLFILSSLYLLLFITVCF